MQRKPLDTLFELVIIDLAEVIHSLVIDPDRQNKVPEDILRYSLAPRHLLTSLERKAYILQEILPCVICQVSRRHRTVQKLHCLTLLHRELLIKHCEAIAIGKQFLTLCPLIVNLLPKRTIGYKMVVATCHRKQ